jgi:hypothetical protein
VYRNATDSPLAQLVLVSGLAACESVTPRNCENKKIAENVCELQKAHTALQRPPARCTTDARPAPNDIKHTDKHRRFVPIFWFLKPFLVVHFLTDPSLPNVQKNALTRKRCPAAAAAAPCVCEPSPRKRSWELVCRAGCRTGNAAASSGLDLRAQQSFLPGTSRSNHCENQIFLRDKFAMVRSRAPDSVCLHELHTIKSQSILNSNVFLFISRLSSFHLFFRPTN